MQEYQGQPCLICGQAFTETDDIVTCPECGTPYHRACWKETGRCINAPLHVSGGSWQLDRQQKAAEERSAEKRAEEAEQEADRERNGDRMINAGLYDGVRLNPADPCIGLDPNEQVGGASMRDVAEFVSTNKFYYLPLFHFMQKTGKKFSFNLVCLLFPEFYFANRKMWLLSLGTMLLNVVLNIPTAILYFAEYMNISIPWADVETALFQQIYSISGIIWMIFKTVACLFANYLYFRFAAKRASRIRSSASSEAEYHAQMHSAGGTSAVNIVLALVIKGAMLFTMMAMVLLVR